MNKRILVSDSEKNSILNMHESFKKNGFVMEQKLSDLRDGVPYSIEVKPNGDLVISTEDNFEINIGKGKLNPKDGMIIISKENGKRMIKGKNSGTIYKTI